MVTAFALAVLTVVTTIAPEQAFAQARVLISNIGQPGTGDTSILSGGGNAQSFTTGANADGYIVSSIEMLTDYSGGSPAYKLPTMTLRSGSVSGTVLATLTKPSSGSNTLEYTLSSWVALDASTAYWVVLATGSGFFPFTNWGTVDGAGKDASSLTDWSLPNAGQYAKVQEQGIGRPSRIIATESE